MNLEQLNFHHLFYFWRVAKLGHLTRAAEDLHTSQSALSAQIRQLEDRIGEDLFSREGRRLVLTDTGQLVLSYAENIFGLGQEIIAVEMFALDGDKQITRLQAARVAVDTRYRCRGFADQLGAGQKVQGLAQSHHGAQRCHRSRRRAHFVMPPSARRRRAWRACSRSEKGSRCPRIS